jgi:hypothetical protein
MNYRPRTDGGVMFTPEERAALDTVPLENRIVCGVCERVTVFRRGILGNRVVYSCERFCGSVSATLVTVHDLAS